MSLPGKCHSLAPEVTNGHIHHSLRCRLTFGRGLGDFSVLFFYIYFFLLAYLHGRVLISSEMPLRNKAGQVCQGGKSPGVRPVNSRGQYSPSCFSRSRHEVCRATNRCFDWNRFHQGNIPHFKHPFDPGQNQQQPSSPPAAEQSKARANSCSGLHSWGPRWPPPSLCY